MSNENEERDGTESELNEFEVFGWAEAAPSNKLKTSKLIEELTHDEQIEVLKKDLRERGFPEHVIESEVSIEIDYADETLESQQSK